MIIANRTAFGRSNSLFAANNQGAGSQNQMMGMQNKLSRLRRELKDISANKKNGANPSNSNKYIDDKKRIQGQIDEINRKIASSHSQKHIDDQNKKAEMAARYVKQNEEMNEKAAEDIDRLLEKDKKANEESAKMLARKKLESQLKTQTDEYQKKDIAERIKKLDIQIEKNSAGTDLDLKLSPADKKKDEKERPKIYFPATKRGGGEVIHLRLQGQKKYSVDRRV